MLHQNQITNTDNNTKELPSFTQEQYNPTIINEFLHQISELKHQLLSIAEDTNSKIDNIFKIIQNHIHNNNSDIKTDNNFILTFQKSSSIINTSSNANVNILNTAIYQVPTFALLLENYLKSKNIANNTKKLYMQSSMFLLNLFWHIPLGVLDINLVLSYIELLITFAQDQKSADNINTNLLKNKEQLIKIISYLENTYKQLLLVSNDSSHTLSKPIEHIKETQQKVSSLRIYLENSKKINTNIQDLALFRAHNTKPTTINNYIKNIIIISTWGYKNKTIPIDYLKPLETLKHYEQSSSHQSALNCECFINLQDAKKKYHSFMLAMCREHLKEDTSTNSLLIKLWLIHAILGTRRSETIRVIKNYQKGNSTVTIKTKCYPSFIIPITKCIKSIIEDIQPQILNLTDRTAEEYLYKAIPKKFKYEMTTHGTRAFFRTVIELMKVKQSFEVKEAYICHNVMTQVQSAYMRNNFLEQRAKLQSIWGTWILNTLSSKYYQQLFGAPKNTIK